MPKEQQFLWPAHWRRTEESFFGVPFFLKKGTLFSVTTKWCLTMYEQVGQKET